jgi:hypothetical protein
VDVDGFWALVGRSAEGIDVSDPVTATEAQIEALRQLLEALPDPELLAFQQWLHKQTARANDWRLWAAGYLAAGGMSDDAFDYFRLWLVLQGRSAFDRLLADPDSLADLRWDPDGEAFEVSETLGYLVAEILEDRGLDASDTLVTGTADGEPAGTPFDEDDEDGLAAAFPRLSSRVEDHAERVMRYRDTTDADVAAFVRATTGATEARSVEPTAPLLAAELYDRGWIRPQDRPMLAAYWLAEDKGGDAVLELASLRGHEPEVSDLWPMALQELGVMLPITSARVAMAWAAQRVLDRERDLRWMVRMLWPDQRHEGSDPDFEELIYTLDDWLDWTGRDLRGRQPGVKARAESARRAVHTAVEAMARDDVAGALRVLREWPDT